MLLMLLLLRVQKNPKPLVLGFYWVLGFIGFSDFLPRDARSAKCGIAIVSRPSVRLSVCNVDVSWAYRLD